MYHGQSVSLILPTYNEKDSIREVINNFAALGVCDEIIVINNNAKEGTSQEVSGTAAREVLETDQGYGAAIMRGLKEARGELVVVCEPDGTFLERDIFKLLEYSRDFNVVYGSRTLNDLIWDGANMGWFLRFGNWSVAKLMEVLYGSISLSDVSCTYRLMNRRTLDLVLATIRSGLKNVQIPLNYKERVGVSSVTGNHFVAFKLGLRMIWLIVSQRFAPFPPPGGGPATGR